MVFTIWMIDGRGLRRRSVQRSVSYMFNKQHKPLTPLKTKHDQILRWRMELSCNDFEIFKYNRYSLQMVSPIYNKWIHACWPNFICLKWVLPFIIEHKALMFSKGVGRRVVVSCNWCNSMLILGNQIHFDNIDYHSFHLYLNHQNISITLCKKKITRCEKTLLKNFTPVRMMKCYK